jgi:LPXTG-site transpeptidase (sortase) family protein
MSGLHIQHKRNFHVMRWTMAFIAIVAVVAYAYFGIRWYSTGELSPLPLPVAAADASVDETPITKKQISEHRVAADEPRYIEVPTIGITSTRVMRVGVTDRNLLDVPTNSNDAGWYIKSAKPGTGAGAVVIDAHNAGATRDGVFAKLGELKTGDQITVERGDGEVFVYEVYDVRDKPLSWVNKSGMKEMMYSVDSSKEGLSLITGSGRWRPKDKVYDRRVLVRATLVE